VEYRRWRPVTGSGYAYTIHNAISQFTAFSQSFYTTYICVLLEYNTYIWSPHNVYYNITKIESVQRRFTKRILSVSHLWYSERLEFLGSESLEYIRLVADLTMMYKIVHNMVDVDRNALITLIQHLQKNSLLKLTKQTSLSSVRAQFLCMLYINACNYLPEEARSSISVSGLKKVCLLTT